MALSVTPARAQDSCDPEKNQIDLGVIYENITAEAGVRGYANSLGANLNDLDGDGDIDIYSLAGPSRVEEAVYYNGESLLYLNNGDLTFTEEGSELGLDDLCEDRAVMFGDLDNDLLPDLYITVNGRNLVYRNHGNGVYEDVTPWSGAADHPGWGHQGFMFDYDRDGYLDLFFTNGPEDGSGFNTLLRNENGTFRDVSVEAGIAGDPSGKGSCVLDANLDHWPDIFVATGREFGNHLFINQGDGTFAEEALEWGVNDPFQRFGIGPSCGDMDNDGDPDIFLVTHDKWWSGNVLYENQGDHFIDIAEDAGVEDFLDGHGHAQVDFDLDGYLDYVLSGIGTPPYLLLNNQDNTFSQVCFGGGVFQANSLTWAVAAGDLTADGYPELYITNGLGRRPADNELFLALGNFGNHWLTVEVQGVTHNPSQIGAKLELTLDGETQTRWVGGWSSFDSQGPLPVTFGLGDETNVDTLVVTFTNGTVVEMQDIEADQQIVVIEPDEWEDEDHDGVPDEWDACPSTRLHWPTDGEGCALGQRGGAQIGLSLPPDGSVAAGPPTFLWSGDYTTAVLQISTDGTFGPTGRFDFGPIAGATYTPTDTEWDEVTATTDGTKPMVWRVVATRGEGDHGATDPRVLYAALEKDQVNVPEGANGFQPAHIVVDAGTTVLFSNDNVESGNLQNEPHDVQILGPDGRIFSDKIDLEGGQDYLFTFEQPGVYPFTCHRHSGIGHHGDGIHETDTHSHGHANHSYHCMSGTVTVR